MTSSIRRRQLLAASAAASLGGLAGLAQAQDKVKLRLSSPSSATDQRAVALTSVFAPAVAGFATFEPLKLEAQQFNERDVDLEFHKRTIQPKRARCLQPRAPRSRLAGRQCRPS